MPNFQPAQDILEHTEKLFEDIPRNDSQAYIKYKSYIEKETETRDIKKVHITQLKNDQQGS